MTLHTTQKKTLVRTLLDTGNTLTEAVAISENLHRQLGVGFSNRHKREIGTAKRGSNLTKLGRSNRIEMSIEGINKKIVIRPSVIRGLSDSLNLGSQFFSKLGLKDTTMIKFCKGKTTLVIGEEQSELINNMGGKRGRTIKRVKTVNRQREKSVPQRSVEICSISDQRVKRHSLTFIKAILPESKKYVNKSFHIDNKQWEYTEVVGAFYQTQPDVQRIAILNNSDKDVIIKKGAILGKVEFMEPKSIGDIQRMEEKESEEVTQELQGEELEKHQQKILADLKIEDNEMLREHPEAKDKMIKLVRRFWKTFGEPNLTTGLTELAEFKIRLKPNTVPHRAKLRPLNPDQLDSLEAQLEIWLGEDVIEEVESPWCSALVAAAKKHAIGPVRHRWAVDYRILNEATISDSYPLPSIAQNLERLAGSRVFSALDTAAAYNVIPVSKESRPLLAFITPRGIFTFKRMPFGPKNSASCYARFIESLLRKLNSNHCQAYLDDVIIYTGDVEEHLREMEAVLALHEEANIKLRPHKCHVFRKKVDYLGFSVSEKGVEMRKEYVDKILEWPKPETGQQMATYIGFISYYRQFIPDFSALTAEMNGQKKKDKIEWTEQMIQDFETLRKQFEGRPIRGYPRYDIPQPFILTTDWSKKAVGGVLSQEQDGAERMLACVGRKCTKHETNYASVKGELAALIFSVRKFEHLLRYRPFIVRTDSSALKYLKNLQCPTGLWFRWLEELSSYDFEVQHKKGVENKNADALSRSDHMDEPTPAEEEEQENEYMANMVRLAKELDCDLRQKDAKEAEKRKKIRNMNQRNEDLSREELIKMQEEDPVINEVRGWVQENRKPDRRELRGREEEIKVYHSHFESLVMENGLLYYTAKLNNIDGMTAHRVVMSRDQKELVFQHSHLHPTAGHFGAVGTLKRAKRWFYYHGMGEDLRRMCATCSVCLAKRRKVDTKGGEHHPVNSGFKGEVISVDLVGPYPESLDKKRYCLTIQDCFTNYVTIVPIPNKNSTTVANALLERYICVHGMPTQIKSDNGTEFCNGLLNELMDRLQIKKSTTPVYSPWSNKVERFHRTLTSMLRTHLDREDIGWTRVIPLIQLAYNTKVNETTGVTPYLAQYGEEARLPIDLVITPPRPELQRRSLHTYVEDLISRLRKIYKIMRESWKSTIKRNSAGYKNLNKEYEEGDLVYYLCPRQIPGKSPKLTDQWLGPYKIVKQVNKVVYKIAPASHVGPSCVVHEARLVKYTGDNLKNRVPERLRIQDEGDETGEELRPSGSSVVEDNIPISHQEGELITDSPVLVGTEEEVDVPHPDVPEEVTPTDGMRESEVPDQVEEPLEEPVIQYPNIVEDEISDPGDWSDADTPPPLVPKTVKKRSREEEGASQKDHKTMKRRGEKRESTQESSTGRNKEIRVQGEKRTAGKATRESKRIKEYRKGEKRSFEEMKLDQALYGGSSEDEQNSGRIKQMNDDKDFRGGVRATKRQTLPPGGARKILVNVQTIPAGYIAVLDTSVGLKEMISVEAPCIEEGQTGPINVWICNKTEHPFTLKRGQRLASSTLRAVTAEG